MPFNPIAGVGALTEIFGIMLSFCICSELNFLMYVGLENVEQRFVANFNSSILLCTYNIMTCLSITRKM
jgi:hypothetical protein